MQDWMVIFQSGNRNYQYPVKASSLREAVNLARPKFKADEKVPEHIRRTATKYRAFPMDREVTV